MKKIIVPLLGAVLAVAGCCRDCANDERLVKWEFPLFYSQMGLPFSDARTGYLVWGSNTLNVTVSRVDLWDHRGGYEWTEEQSYANIRKCLESRDVDGLNKLFEKKSPQDPAVPNNPYMLPLGMVKFDLDGWMPVKATLDPFEGVGKITIEKNGSTELVKVALGKDGTLAIAWPKGFSPRGKSVSSFDLPYVNGRLSKTGFTAATYFGDEKKGGFEWPLPADPSASVAFETIRNESFVASKRGGKAEPVTEGGFAHAERGALEHWRKWWSDAAKVNVPDRAIQELYDYGMYRFGAMTDPAGVPAPLQGPWYEECKIPPWNGDYHFNINIQMCYWPAYAGNKLANLMPMFKMVKSWWPQLRENARKFCGVEDGFMLPHSVDDRGTLIGGFWMGTIDHGCTAWIAQLMFRYVTYSGDLEFLKSDAYPFMKGAMKVYRAIMDERDGKLTMAATVSPEWWGDGPPDDAWGRDASFQLAACHRLAADLVRAAKMLGEEPDPVWLDVQKRLPKCSTARQTSCVRRTDTEIGLFQDKRLPESHRHHSHMAGLVPFDTIDFEADKFTTDLVRETYGTWLIHGKGLWAGWSMPWAAMLYAHVGLADSASLTLRIWKEMFTNPGHGSRHNPYFPGYSLMKQPFGSRGEGGGEVMQMDGAMASVAAVHYMLCHERQGAIRLFAGAPVTWKKVSFDGILTDGGVLVSAERIDGKVTSVTLKATRAATVRIASPWKKGEFIDVNLKSGEVRMLTNK